MMTITDHEQGDDMQLGKKKKENIGECEGVDEVQELKNTK